MKQEKLKEIAEKLKDKELFKESNDRARKVLSEIKSLPIVETLEQIDQNNPVTRGSTALVYKQETLEEAGEKLYPNRESFLYRFQNIERKAFTEGAKWQLERSYSEEEVNHLEWIYNRMINVYNENENYDYMIRFKNIIEQFKKK
jgi:hypothetical protein